MTQDIAAAFLSLAFGLALLSALTTALAAAVVVLFQRSVLMRGLRGGLVLNRKTHYHDRGFLPSNQLLKQQTTEEAYQLVSGGTSTTTAGTPAWTADLRQRVDAAFANPEVLADVRDDPDRKDGDREERTHLRTALLQRADVAQQHWMWWQRATIGCAGLLFAVAFQYDALHVLANLGAGTASIPARIWPHGIQYFLRDGSLDTGHVLGTVLSALALAAIAGLALWRLTVNYEKRNAVSMRRAPPPPPPAKPVGAAPAWPEEDAIGRGHHPIRVINFASGGFDTVMQIGVIQAAVVIQGRVPDAVVGISAGAVSAVAMAEVLQAGEDSEREALKQNPWEKRSPEECAELQHSRLLARVKRLREHIEAAQRAPERLVEALLPDAYQIERGKPLSPLQQPRFSQEERRQRAEYVSRRTGLALLYNHLLSVPLSFGTLIKATRRILGIIASAEIPVFKTRWAIRIAEAMRLWLSLGLHLPHVAKLSRILLRPYVPWVSRPSPATAATLIFTSRFISSLLRYAAYVLVFVVLWMSWVCVSLVAVPLYGGLAVGIVANARRPDPSPEAQGAATDAWQGVVLLTLLTLTWVCVAFIPLALWCPQPLHLIRHHPGISCLVILALDLLLGGIVWLSVRRSRGNPHGYIERLLATYDLGDAIFRDHGLRSYLANLFDPNYYVKPPMDAAVASGLRHRNVTPAQNVGLAPGPKKVSHYHSKQRLAGERIHVGLAVANTEKGSLHLVPDEVSLIDGLMASTAITPWLPPVELTYSTGEGTRRTSLFIDGTNVSREPMHALLKLLRERCRKDPGPVQIFSVTPFPVSGPDKRLEATGARMRKGSLLNLMDVVLRALRLQKFRDATLERDLTELISSAIPEGKNEIALGQGEKSEEVKSEERKSEANRKRLLRAWVTPVELDVDADITRRIFGASKEARRAVIEQTIADGCRAALQVMIPETLQGQGRMSCKEAVNRHLNSIASNGLAPLGDEHARALLAVRFPGSEQSSGSGIPEICARCSLNRRRDAPGDRQALLLNSKWSEIAQSWPHERDRDGARMKGNQAGRTTTDMRFKLKPSAETARIDELWGAWAKTRGGPDKPLWPRPALRPDSSSETPHELIDTPGNNRSTVSLLFSGGVFRGVYQVGVLNGLNELTLEPDVIAGASVGSITAAMIARAFSLKGPEREAHIARIAAVYLTIDRLVLTDRFADSIRNLTLRAAELRFSIRQADRVFRKYDYPSFFEFDRNMRHVLAGIERLFYVGPYRLNEIVRACRQRDRRSLKRLLKKSVQLFLDRMEIGEEALGAEPLSDLIQHYVVPPEIRDTGCGYPVDSLRDVHQIQFLATTTNLSEGRLEVFGEEPGSVTAPGPLLEPGLLASSAFPGVFRPRWSWELTGGAPRTAQYVDGGVMDNLPLNAVAAFLERAGRKGLIKPRPSTPHLVIGASLQERAHEYQLDYTRRRLKRSWMALRRRAKQLGYNTKLDAYEYAEDVLRTIVKMEDRPSFPVQDRSGSESELIGLQLVSIKPNWLCGTFAFHPMLGFRREKQAMSIAHGCATTLLEFARLHDKDKSAGLLRNWGVAQPEKVVPQSQSWSTLFAKPPPAAQQEAGKCWLRPDCDCPFSRKKLLANGLEPAVVDAVSMIHDRCPKPETHLRAI